MTDNRVRFELQTGDRVLIEGTEYMVTRVVSEQKRGQIDLIPVDEALRRIASLNELLDMGRE